MYHFEEPFSCFNSSSSWNRIEVFLFGHTQSSFYYVDSYGPFLFLRADSSKDPEITFFIPNFLPKISQYQKSNCTILCSSFDPDFSHIFILSDSRDNRAFCNFLTASSVTFFQTILSIDPKSVYKIGTLEAIFPGIDSPIKSLCIMQKFSGKYVFQTQYLSNSLFAQGFEVDLKPNVYVNTLCHIPKKLGAPSQAHLCFTILDSKTGRQAFFKGKSDIECMQWVLSIFFLTRTNVNQIIPKPNFPKPIMIDVEVIEELQSSPHSPDTPQASPFGSPESTQQNDVIEPKPVVQTPRKKPTIFKMKRHSMEDDLMHLRDEISHLPQPLPFSAPDISSLISNPADLSEKDLLKQYDLALSKLPQEEPDFSCFDSYSHQSTVSIVNQTIKTIANDRLDLDNLEIPETLAAPLLAADRPYNGYVAYFKSVVQSILQQNDPKVANNQRIGPLISVLFTNGLLGELRDAYREFDFLDSVFESISDQSEFGSFLLNRKILMPLLVIVSQGDFIGTHYLASSLMANDETVKFVMDSMETLNQSVEFDLEVVRVKLSASRFRRPHFMNVGFSAAVNYPDGIVEVLTFGVKGSRPFDVVKAVGNVDPIVNESVKLIEENESQVAMLEKWVENGIKKRNLPLLIALIFNRREIIRESFHHEATLCDPYRCRALIAAINTYLNNHG